MKMTGEIKSNSMEHLYLALRTSEGRLYTNEELAELPHIKPTHQHAAEWRTRTRSLERLKKYLRRHYRGRKLSVLDVGCGNGWMSNSLGKHGHHVTGVDINLAELEQAELVFGSSDTLGWVYGDIFDDAFDNARYDVIVLAASCQYFASLDKLTQRLKSLLTKDGQVHLIDSKFYNEDELADARQRTVDYYFKSGFSQMSVYYFHHSRAVVKKLGYRRLYPSALNLLSNNASLEWWMLQC